MESILGIFSFLKCLGVKSVGIYLNTAMQGEPQVSLLRGRGPSIAAVCQKIALIPVH